MLNSSALEPPRLAALGTPPNLGGELKGPAVNATVAARCYSAARIAPSSSFALVSDQYFETRPSGPIRTMLMLCEI